MYFYSHLARFLLGVMILNMVQIVQAAFANVLHTSTTICIPLPTMLNKFLKLISCTKKGQNNKDGGSTSTQNGRQKNVILTEQGNSIANLNANEKDGIEMEPFRNADGNQPGETDQMFEGEEELPDYTEDWKHFFLCLDKLCFIILVVIISIVFFYMIYY